jgi:hypothetical protein
MKIGKQDSSLELLITLSAFSLMGLQTLACPDTQISAEGFDSIFF